MKNAVYNVLMYALPMSLGFLLGDYFQGTIDRATIAVPVMLLAITLLISWNQRNINV